MVRLWIPITALVFLALAAALVGCDSGREQSSASRTPPPPPPKVAPKAPAKEPPAERPKYDMATLRAQEPSTEVDIEIGNLFLEAGENDSALVYYGSAVERSPEDAKAWNFYGLCLSRLGRLADAKEAYARAIDADAFFTHSYVNLGNIHYGMGEMEQAIAAYEVAVNVDSTEALSWRNLALAYKKEDMTNKAIHAFQKMAECDPTDSMPWENLGWIYYEKKLYSSSRDRWQKAVDRDPTRDDLRENIQRLLDYAESTGTP